MYNFLQKILEEQ